MPSLKELFSRFRYTYMFLGSLVVLLALVSADPEVGLLRQLPFGAPVVATILRLAMIVVFVTAMHLSRKGLFDYIDLSEYFEKAKEEPIGAGLALVAVAIVMNAIASLIQAAVQ